jgi:hypothetical protein
VEKYDLDPSGGDDVFRAVTVTRSTFQGEHEVWLLDFTPEGEPTCKNNECAYGRTRIYTTHAAAMCRLRM